MKIVRHIENDERNYGQYARVTIFVNDKKVLSIGGGESEDMTLYRDLSDALNIVDLMGEAYNAGKNGEELNVEFTEED